MTAGRRALATLAGVVVVLAGLAGLAVTAAPTFADRGQTSPDATSSVFTVHADGSVHVDVDATISNDESCPAGYVCFFDAMVLPAPTAAFDFTSDSGAVSTVTDNDFAQGVVVHLSSQLTTGHTRSVHVGYDLGGAARSNPFVRVNRAYVEFFAFGDGAGGHVDVTISVPDSFAPTVDFATMDKTDDGHTTTFTARAIADPRRWTAAFTARNDAALVHHTVAVAGHAVTIRSWPGDDTWAGFVSGEVRKGVPVLDALVGASLPKRDVLTITETAAPYLYGYAGWYTDTENSIEIGDDLDATVVLHEISHEWFNRDLFSDRWVDEGLAQEYSTRAVARLGAALQQPTKPDPHAAGHVTLNAWSNPDVRSTQSGDEEHYGYNASFYVMRRIADDIGTTRMAQVLAAARRGDISYVGNGAPEHQSGAYSWTALLDLFDNVGHSKVADALFRSFVVDSTDAARLTTRAIARAQYGALVQAGRGWAAPIGVRQAMHDWSFATATTQMALARAVLARRDEAARAVAPFHVAVPSAEHDYEASFDQAPVVATMTRLRDAALVVARAHRAVAEPRGFWQKVGLVGDDPAGTVRSADRAFSTGDAAGATRAANAAIAAIADAASAGRTRAVIALGVLVAAGLLGVLIRRRRRRRRTRRAAAAPLESDVLHDALVGASSPSPSPSSPSWSPPSPSPPSPSPPSPPSPWSWSSAPPASSPAPPPPAPWSSPAPPSTPDPLPPD